MTGRREREPKYLRSAFQCPFLAEAVEEHGTRPVFGVLDDLQEGPGSTALRKRVAALARMHTEEAILKIVEIMRDEDAGPKVRLNAANYILDRGWSRPPVATSLYFEDDEPHQEGDEGERIIPVLASILADIAAQEEKLARELEAERSQSLDAADWRDINKAHKGPQDARRLHPDPKQISRSSRHWARVMRIYVPTAPRARVQKPGWQRHAGTPDSGAIFANRIEGNGDALCGRAPDLGRSGGDRSTRWSSTVLEGELVSKGASRLDAFSGYPVRT